MAEERIDIVVTQKGATEVKRSLEEIGQAAGQTSPTIATLKAALAAVSSTADKLKASLGASSMPVRELKRVMDELNRTMASFAGSGFSASISAPTASMGALTAAAVRAAGGVTALGEGFVLLGRSVGGALVPLGSVGSALAVVATGSTALAAATSTALVPLVSMGSALATIAPGLTAVAVASASTAVSVLSSSTALSTMTISIAELSRRIIELGYLLAMLRAMFAQGLPSITQLNSGILQLGNGMSQAGPAIGQASQLLLTYEGSLGRAAASGGLFAGVVQRMQGLWGAFTGGVRSAWTAMTGLASSLQGGWTNMAGTGAALQGIGSAAQGAVPGVNALQLSFFSLWRIILALTIAAQVWRSVTGAIDEWIGMSNKLRQVSEDSQNLAASQEAVYQAAQRTRSGMEEMATLYARTSAATKDLGLSQRDVLGVTETVAMAMKLNGGSVQETASAMRQLSQAFNKGKLDGDEFRSIMENAPALQKAFTEGLKVTKAELYAMSSAGQLTLPKLIAAIQSAGPAIRESFDGTLPTIAEGFTYLGNSLTRFLGQLNEATGFSRSFYEAMRFLGDNLGVLGVAFAVLGTAVLVAFGPAAISALASFGAALAVATGGLSLILPILAGLAAATYAWGDSWKVTADGVTVLDYIRAALSYVGEAVSSVTGAIGTGFRLAWAAVEGSWGGASSFFGDLLGGIGSLMQATVSTYLGVWVGLYNAIVAAFDNLPAALAAIFQLAMNGTLDVVQGGLNGIIGAINTVLEKVSAPLVPTVDLSGFKADLGGAAGDMAQSISGAFEQGMQTGRDATQALIGAVTAPIDALTAKAKEISAARRAVEANQPQLSTERGPNTYQEPAGKAKKSGGKSAAEKLQDELNSLLRTVDPITGATEKLRQGTETLDKAYAGGLISLERRNDLMSRLKEHMRDQLDPLGKINRDMEKEAELLRLGNDERAIQKQLLDDVEKLRRAGVNLSPVEMEALEQNIRGLERMKEQARLLGDVLDRTFKGAEDAFVGFIETGKVNFSELVTSMIADVARMSFQSMVTKPLTGMLTNLLGGVLPSIGGLFGGTGGYASALPTAPLSGAGLFATGGGFTVGGQGGVDSQMVQFRASPGERVSVSRAGSEGSNGNSGPQIVFNIQTPDVQSFRASEAQIAARMAKLAGRGNRNL